MEVSVVRNRSRLSDKAFWLGTVLMLAGIVLVCIAGDGLIEGWPVDEVVWFAGGAITLIVLSLFVMLAASLLAISQLETTVLELMSEKREAATD
ncbi:hypothetical protein ACQPZF_05695 [Actinosynnema sp. CS-041913]|uniref:hypothetical protein n=1 Tax=Actinosynnema sp. CS-041913 TaxID=3239917 RepID=UPI003D94A6AB